MLKKWSKSEEERFKIIYPKVGVKICSDIFGRTISSIKNKAFNLDLSIDFNPGYNKGFFNEST